MGASGKFLMLGVMGAAWGLTLPLTNISVSTGFKSLGLLVWQTLIMAVLLSGPVIAMGKRLEITRRYLGLYFGVAILGTILPGYFSFLTAAHLPAGVRSIIIASVPMFVLPMALALGHERPDMLRAAGVLAGAAAIVLIAMPGAGLAATAGIGMILLALISPLSYAMESIFLAWHRSSGLHPFQLLLGASIAGIALSWPLAVVTGQTVGVSGSWGPAEWSILATSVIHVLAYSGYVWLVAHAGPVFASQIAYVVTAFGVIWSKVLLSESYSLWIWAALALMLAGVTLVRPKDATANNP
jgi:drug/metabolite transporter (DMT)-like permease